MTPPKNDCLRLTMEIITPIIGLMEKIQVVYSDEQSNFEQFIKTLLLKKRPLIT